MRRCISATIVLVMVACNKPGENDCNPPCSPGYVCVDGECVEPCNPPCGPDERCNPDTATCEPLADDSETAPDAPDDSLEDVDSPDAVSDADVPLDTSEDEAGTECLLDGDCDDGDPCTSDVCNSTTSTCEHDLVDADDDGHPALEVDGRSCAGGTDCDDTRDDIHPGAIPLCDGEDHDCSGMPDNNEDGDAYISMALCSTGEDCDDTRPDVYPGAPGVCLDGIDQDCDGYADNPGPLSSDIRVTTTGNRARFPSVAWSGSQYGFAWHEYVPIGGAYHIYFNRLSPTGTVIGTVEDFTTTAGLISEPIAVWTGSEYGLVWSDMRVGGMGGTDEDIYFTRISAAGSQVGSQSMLSDGTTIAREPAMTWTGSQYGIAWVEHASYWALHFARLAPDGTPIGSTIEITDGTGWTAQTPSLVWSGSEFCCLWSDDRNGHLDVYQVIIPATGDTTSSHYRVSNDPAYQMRPALDWSGSEYGTVWLDGRGGFNSMYFARVSPTGGRLMETVISTLGVGNTSPAILWTGSEYAAAWSDSSGEMQLAVIEADGTVKTTAEIQISSGGLSVDEPSFALTSSEIGILWHDDRVGGSNREEIYFNSVGFCDI